MQLQMLDICMLQCLPFGEELLIKAIVLVNFLLIIGSFHYVLSHSNCIEKIRFFL